MSVEEEAKRVVATTVQIIDKARQIITLAEAVGFHVEDIALTSTQKQQILERYHIKKTELERLVSELS